MTRNAALAGAARRVRALADRLPPSVRRIADARIAASWEALLASIEDATDRQALDRIAAWLEREEERLCGMLAHAPLEEDAA